MSTRIYIVAHIIKEVGQERRLVEAATPAEAIRHVVKGSITCAVATPAELIEATKAGVEVERAGDSA